MIGFNQLKFDLTTTCISQKWPAGPALATYVEVHRSSKPKLFQRTFNDVYFPIIIGNIFINTFTTNKKHLVTIEND
jgi:hypothetical protein